jgi:predicted acyl esterase
MEVIGVPVVEVAHRSDNLHADLFFRVSEVDPRGRSLDGARASPGWTPQRPTTSSGSSSMPWPTASPRAAGSGC